MSLDKRYQKAAAILAAFEDRYGGGCDGTVRCFSNCREQGFVISLHHWEERMKNGRGWRTVEARLGGAVSVAFAENRNSDNIVVYRIGGYTEMPSEDEWKDAKYFAPFAYVEVAQYIWRLLTAACNRQPRRKSA